MIDNYFNKSAEWIERTRIGQRVQYNEFAAAIEKSQPAGHGLLLGAGTRDVPERNALSSLPQVIVVRVGGRCCCCYYRIRVVDGSRFF